MKRLTLLTLAVVGLLVLWQAFGFLYAAYCAGVGAVLWAAWHQASAADARSQGYVTEKNRRTS